MRAIEARTIAICHYLEANGIKPDRVRASGRELWYKSPIRTGDNDPSFKVDTVKNLWFDHGIARGGNVIDLVCELQNVTVKEALSILEATGLHNAPHRDNLNLFSGSFPSGGTRQAGQAEKKRFAPAGEKEKRDVEASGQNGGHFQILKVGELQHPALIEYLGEREIDLEIARQYLKEVHFKPADQLRQYFALGWPSGEGFDVRNRLFKGFVGVGKDISTVNLRPGGSLYIFEGWMDFLSYLSLHKTKTFNHSALILHSTSLKKRAAQCVLANNIQRLTLFLDNDQAGLETAEFFKLALPDIKIFDRSHLYKPAKDLNERLIERQLRLKSKE